MNSIAELIGQYLYYSGIQISKLTKTIKRQSKINKLLYFEIVLIYIMIFKDRNNSYKLNKRLRNLEAEYYRHKIEEHKKAEKE